MTSVHMIGLGIIVVWVGVLAYYFWLNSQHKELHDDIQQIEKLLDE